MIEFLSYFYVISTILLIVFLYLTNAFIDISNKEIIGIVFWPIVVAYLIIKLYVSAFVFTIQEIYSIFKY